MKKLPAFKMTVLRCCYATSKRLRLPLKVLQNTETVYICPLIYSTRQQNWLLQKHAHSKCATTYALTACRLAAFNPKLAALPGIKENFEICLRNFQNIF